jgi:hypothetical protein
MPQRSNESYGWGGYLRELPRPILWETDQGHSQPANQFTTVSPGLTFGLRFSFKMLLFAIKRAYTSVSLNLLVAAHRCKDVLFPLGMPMNSTRPSG